MVIRAIITDVGGYDPVVPYDPIALPTAPAAVTTPPYANSTGVYAADTVPFFLSVADFPKPVLNKYGRPVNWNETDLSSNGKTIGRYRVLVGGKDVTFFRNTLTVVRGWTDNEPFGDASAEIAFPQVSTFETPGMRDLTWFREWSQVHIELVLNAGVTVRSEGKYWTGPTRVPLFEGIVPAFEDSLTETDNTLTLTAMGILYQLDLYTMPPDVTPRDVSDIGYRIANAINTRAFSGSTSLGFRGNRCTPVTTGVASGQAGAWDKLLSGYIQDLLAVCQTSDGKRATLSLTRPVTPVIKWKNTTTVHWTVWAGQPGVTYSLSSDWTGAFNVYYGEGTDNRGRHWRNTKYPNLHPDTAPLYPGSPSSIFTPGGGKTGFLPFAQRMYEHGYIHMHRTNTYNSNDEDDVRDVQRRKGILVDGRVGPQTWAAVFQVGSNEGDLNGSYFMPIAEWTAVEPWRYNGQGAKVGKNKHFDPNAVRIERYDNYGDHTTKRDAIRSAQSELKRSYHNPGWTGTITLTADLVQGSRFLIRSGENILIRGFKGHGWDPRDKGYATYLFHIAQVDRDLTAEPPTVTLTVDTKARDLMSIAQIMDRDYNTRHPSDRGQINARQSRITQDEIVVWDYENGAGIIPKHAQYGGLWTVMRIPAGERGNISATHMYTYGPHSPFAIAVFASPVTDVWLRGLLGNPLKNFTVKNKDGTSTDYNPWDYHAKALDDAGYLYAAGGPDLPAGYWPTNDTSQAKNLSGFLKDDASWYFESNHAPWLWVAVYTKQSCWFEGRFYPGSST